MYIYISGRHATRMSCAPTRKPQTSGCAPSAEGIQALPGYPKPGAFQHTSWRRTIVSLESILGTRQAVRPKLGTLSFPPHLGA